ncbi:MAG: redox-regulated ATPase YchF [Candidatus Saelkia tenebricola]|nr:redox-regulated ATPase YchF [Candidatus Saelkia tenebricola]
MKIGIIGLPQTGKKTIFKLLTGYEFSEKDLTVNKVIKSFAQIKDPRFDFLSNLYKPKKQVRAKIDIELLPKIDPASIRQGGIFENIADFDAICHIVRAFKDDAVYHIDGLVDPKRDIESINSELILHDLLFIEKRIERIDEAAKRVKDEKALKEKELLLKLKDHLDRELPLRLLDLTAQELCVISSYPFITLKKMIIVLNISENNISDESDIDKLQQDYKSLEIDIMQVSAKVESDIIGMDSESERVEFFESLGVKELAVDSLTRLCIKALDLISFFTVGSDEVRQWLLRKGFLAPQAAGVIHSDLEKGFIRAEVIKYDDLYLLGNEVDLKKEGKIYLKGKDYVVEDGDIVDIRFNI